MLPIKDMIKIGVKFCEKNAPTILTVAACVGVGATGYLSFKAGEQAAYDIADELIALDDDEATIDTKTKAKIIVKNVAPAAAVGSVTIAAIISSNVINIRRMKALAASYAILAESADIYRRKVVERIGEHKEDEVRGAIAQDEFAKDADRNDIQIVNTQGGSYLFKDQITKQYFRADADFVRKMQNRVNEFYKQGENFVTVSEWYSYLGLECPGDPVGMLGWPASCGIKFELNSCICPGGEPGYYIMYDVMPMTEDEAENYDRNHYVSDTYDY